MKYFKAIILAVSILAVWFFWDFNPKPQSVFGHGAVVTQSQISGSYRIEFEYNSIYKLYANSYAAYAFRLLDKNDLQKSIPFDSVYVQFSKTGGGVIQNSYLKPFDIGVADLGLNIAQEGNYEAKIDFYLDSAGTNIIRSKFNFQVYPEMESGTPAQKSLPPSAKTWVQKYFWVLALIIGLGSGVWASPEIKKVFNKISRKK